MRTPSPPYSRLDLCPTLGRPVHLRGGAPRLRPGTSPHALRIPPHGGHPALRVLQSGGSRSALAVSDFRLRARLGFSNTFPSPRPARNYPRLWIQRSSFERRRDLNPPESRAAQRTIGLVHPPRSADGPSVAPPTLLELRQVALDPPENRCMRHGNARGVNASIDFFRKRLAACGME